MLKIPKKSILGTVAVAAIAITAACGGSDGDGDGDSLSVDEYIEQADAICARYDEQFAALEQPASADEVRPFIVDTLDIGQRQTAELQALEVPDELADLEAQARANNDEAVVALESAIERIDNGEDIGDVVGDVAAESERLENSNAEISEEMGLEVCGAPEADEASTTENPPDDTLDSEPTATEAPADTGGNAAAQYLLDVNASTTSLNEIGAVFTNADDSADLQAQADAVEASVDEFNGAIDSMATYTLDDPQLEEQRAAFVESGEELEAPLGDLATAVADGDLAAIRATLPALQTGVQDFQAVVAQTP